MRIACMLARNDFAILVDDELKIDLVRKALEAREREKGVVTAFKTRQALEEIAATLGFGEVIETYPLEIRVEPEVLRAS